MNRYRWGVAAAAAASVAIVNPALAQAQPQEIDWVACPEYLGYMDRGGLPADLDWQCGEVEVPVDYADPDGRTIPVSVSRIPAEDQARSKGALFGNPGGPGEQALDFWLPIEESDGPGARLHEDYDLVAVEPRGLSYSGGVACDAPVTAMMDPAAAYKACMETDPQLVQSLTTANTARDMEVVRESLAAENGGAGAGAGGAAADGGTMDYLGYSYGTYLGATYATLYPEETGRFVLDSAVDPDWVWNEQAAQQAEARKQRTDDMFAWIAAHDDTYHLGDTPLKVFHAWKGITDEELSGGMNLTPPDAQMGDLPELVRPVGAPVLDVINATAEPRARADGAVRVLTGADNGRATSGLTGTTLNAAGSREMWPVVARRMQDIRQYGAGTLAPGTRMVDPPQLTTDDVLFTAVTCNENPQSGDPVQAALAQFNANTGGNAYDVMAQQARGGADCAGWPASSAPVPLDGSGLETKPLVLQSQRDALTPYPGGVELADQMDGVLVTVQGGDHGVFGRGNDAVDEVVTDYLVDGVTPQPQVLPEAQIRMPLTPPKPAPLPAAENLDAAMARGFSAASDAVTAAAEEVDQAVAEATGAPVAQGDAAQGAQAQDAQADVAQAEGAQAEGTAAATDTSTDAPDAAADAGRTGPVAQAVDEAVDRIGAALGVQ
ncbi:alpha/beta hydrolase [Tomitella fengzijianii]|uniref:Alpha/beta hydrolase n=1 Tax=Tomitella fengzijianii TaxID=2597660 RepID=A0A516X541_9ACTN|nr:alpha/beta hydrolase [Tomitella fengzijianii]QDQ98198.1 alpha/beta hydrolase [Tomitella fengzijianii]